MLEFVPINLWNELRTDDHALIAKIQLRREQAAYPNKELGKQPQLKAEAMNSKVGPRFYRFIRTHQIDQILELGVGAGIGALYMLAAAGNEAQYVGIEADERRAELAITNLNAMFPCYDYTIKIGMFQEALESSLNLLEPVEFVHIDGDTRTQFTVKRFKICMEHMSSLGYIAVSNIGSMKSCDKQLRKIPGVTFRFACNGCGVYSVVR